MLKSCWSPKFIIIFRVFRLPAQEGVDVIRAKLQRFQAGPWMCPVHS